MINDSDILKARILIVDDQEANVLLLQEMLHEAGYVSVSSTTNPCEACGLHRKNRYHLILLDLQMPVMDGFQVLEALKEIEAGNDLPVLVITAQPGHKLRALRAGAKDFVSKPFDLAEVLIRVHNMLEIRLFHLSGILESEQWLKAIFDQAAVGVAQMDAATGRFLRVNRRLCDLLGFTAGEMERLTVPEVTHEQDAGLDAAEMAGMRNGSIREFALEKRFVRKDGAIAWVSLTMSSIGPPGERPDSLVLVAQDITARKRLDEHLLQAQKMEVLGQFSGGVAHDFNNILAAISGYTELSLISLKENEAVRKYLGSVLQAARRASGVVRQILTFSRQQPQERQAVGLQPIVRETLDLLRVSIPSTIGFDVALAVNAPTVFADANQIHQVLMNLGTNAWHAMKDRPGRMRFALERVVVDAAAAAAHPGLRPGTFAVLTVGDDGIGMDAKTQARIFEPFFTTKPPGQGTGLGLAVVRGIMDAHDGVIAVYSEPGRGTTFRLYFPEFSGSVASAEDPAAPVPRGNDEAILVVDDEELLARLGEEALVGLGYRVTFTTRPEEAVGMVEADPGRFALVLTDQTMPVMSGLVLAGRLRQLQPGLPILLMSGATASLTPARLEAAGVLRLLPKPCSIRSLGLAVHAALESGAPVAELAIS